MEELAAREPGVQILPGGGYTGEGANIGNWGETVGLELTDAAKTHLASVGYDPALGARPLRRAIQRLVEDPLSEKILWKEFEAGELIIVDIEKDEMGENKIVFKKAALPPDHFPSEPVEMAGAGAPAEGDGDAAPPIPSE